ncbi:unnamed protein product [Owenia fusiformis]|uniref:Uncharacterized protein n=1 Tax=Owenia fusiformis TaxID=6347 RepID=A0A8J1Y911_OWEFU|nr:unnamed protein product [Owenia fusiformis]
MVYCSSSIIKLNMAKRIHDVVQRFASGTTIHGVPKLIRAQTIPGKIFWSLICLAALGVFIFELALLLQKFFGYPKSVDVKVVQEPVAFPSVTVCSVHAMDPFVIHKIYKLRQEQMEHRMRRKPWVISKNVSDFEKWYFDTFLKKSMSYVLEPSYLEGLIDRHDLKTEFFPSLSSRLTLAANLNKSITFPGVEPAELIAFCRYARQECSFEHFKTVFDPYYFNCFTFNASVIAGSLKTLAEGIENALSIVMYIPKLHNEIKIGTKVKLPGIVEHDIRDPLAGSGGVRVVIHPPDTQPHPATEGFDIMPGYSVSIGVKTTENTRLGRPYGNCTETTKGVFSDKASYRYTMTSCRKKCLQNLLSREVKDGCGCLDVVLPTFPEVNGVDFCAKFDDIPRKCIFGPFARRNESCKELKARWLKRMICMRDIETSGSHEHIAITENCNCHPPCKDLSYEFFYSNSLWPGQQHKQDVYRDLFISRRFERRFQEGQRTYYFGAENAQALNVTEQEKTVDRFARLNVYLYDTNVVKITETKDYTGIQLISDVGGQLGLWLGISIITLTEVFELIADIVHLCLKRKRKQSIREGNCTPAEITALNRRNGSTTV